MKNIIEEFYRAFANLDAKNMTKHYHPDILFKDPAFGELKANRAISMWHMLCHSQRGKDFKVQYKVIYCNNGIAKAQWDAFYTFEQTGRKVHNKVSALFIIKDGLIIKHIDEFDIHNWSAQALGVKGYLLGKTSFFRRQLQRKTNLMLDEFEANNKQ